MSSFAKYPLGFALTPPGIVTSVNGQVGVVLLDSDDIPQGVTNLYFTNELAQDAVGSILTNTSTIGLTYNDGLNTITADLLNTAVTPGSYGIASSVPTFTVDAQGRLTAALDLPIQIAQSQVTNLVTDLAGKQPTGNYITALTGDATATGPGSAAITLSTVNATTGSFGTASSVGSFVVNAKGLITSAVDTAISITSSAVSDFASAVRSTVLTGLSIVDAVVTASDTVLSAIGKLQGQINSIVADIALWTELITTGDLTNNSNVTLTNITQLALPVLNGGTYYFEIVGVFSSAANTTGITITMGTSDTATGSIAASANIPVAADGANATYSGWISSLGDVVTTNTVPASATNYILSIQGTFICTASGTLVPQFRSEVNGSAITFRTGSIALYRDFT